MKQGTNLHVITWSHTIGLRQVRFRSPTMLSIHLVGASVSEPPLVDSTDALSRYIYTSVRSPLLRMRGATRKRSRPDRESSQSS